MSRSSTAGSTRHFTGRVLSSPMPPSSRSSSPAPTTSSDFNDPSIPWEERFHRLKRVRDSEQVQEKSTPSPKPGSQTKRLGRGFRKLASLYATVFNLVTSGERFETSMLAEEDDPDYDAYDVKGLDPDDEYLTEDELERLAIRRNDERAYFGLQALFKLVPNLRQKLATESKPDELMEFYDKLQAGGNSARANDFRELASALGNWLNNSKQANLKPVPAFLPYDRHNRGLQHDVAGFLLCPIQQDWSNPEIRAKIRAGELKLTTFYCRVFYPNGKGDPQDVSAGFLKSRLLVEAAKFLLTSPSSTSHDADNASDEENNSPPSKKAKRSSKATRGTVAQILNMENKMTPRMIAYIAVMVHCSLTDMPQWSEHYNGISYEQMYNFIVDLFEDCPDADAKKEADTLLKWWTRQVFPVDTVVTASDPSAAGSSRALLAAQRKKKALMQAQAQQAADWAVQQARELQEPQQQA
ncbi:hypothetical protein C8J56DRAFT_909330 [Mycena floridula]|nr:hypothetical protein C8J56DRAFT_909330 [Mycena floridula]